MIYPEHFPEDRKNERAELFMFERLEKLAEKYDIFYSRKFVSNGLGKRPEYEIDFIITIPNKALICLEVKGGHIHYSGSRDVWTQNGREMGKRPDAQASSASHSLVNEYKKLIGDMPIGWGLCFPECQIQNRSALPNSIHKDQVLDELTILDLEYSLDAMFKFIQAQFPYKKGVKAWAYNKFKNQLLRDIGFVRVLSTKIKYDNQRVIELTESQVETFKRVSENNNVITTGPAGSGKTIVAKTLAQDFINAGKKVLFCCFNRTLANKVRYDIGNREENIEVTTFHSIARTIIEKFDKDWWESNDTKAEDFWDLEAPAKFDELIPFVEEKYDVLIIDEGQDFREFWYETLFKLTTEDGHKLIFMDEMQNIFGHYSKIPKADQFFKYKLPENCRNTKKIVQYLSEVVDKEIRSFNRAPEGENLVIKTFKNNLEQQKYLLDEIKQLTREHEIGTDQLLVMLNSSKVDSCLGKTTKAGSIPIKGLNLKGIMQKDAINYTNINMFKGLEADIVFIVDAHLIPEEKKLKKLYTEASRARFKLYILSCSK